LSQSGAAASLHGSCVSILVPIDLSAPSRCAIELAALLAKAVPCEPVLLHVTREQQPSLDLLAALYALASPIHALGINARLRTLPGQPSAIICEEAIRRDARWIVMGTRGAHLGEDSVARQVMVSCPVPVVAVRPAQSTVLNPLASLPGAALGSRIVLISTENSDDRELRHIGGFLARLGGELEVQPADELYAHGKSPRTRPNDLVVTTALQDWGAPWFKALMEDHRHHLVLVSQPTPR
jgi:nucleotide-binding universal stress UspA family protein